MDKLLKITVVLALAVIVYAERGSLHRVLDRTRSDLKSTTNELTGSTAVSIGQLEKRKIVQNTIQSAIAGYRSVHGQDPRSLGDLVDDGLLQRADIVDEWGRPLAAEPGVRGLVVRSLGADGKPGTTDDWQLGR